MLAISLTAPIACYIAYIAVPGSSLFSWHPVCMSLAFGVLLPAGVEAFSLRGCPRGRRVILHWALMVTGVATAAAGLAAIYLNKERNVAPHFTSTHGQLGVITVGVSVVQATGGLLALYAARLPAMPLVAPRLVKQLHALSGCVLAALGLWVVRLGVASTWFGAAAAAVARPAADLLLSLAALRIAYRVLVSRWSVKLD